VAPDRQISCLCWLAWAAILHDSCGQIQAVIGGKMTVKERRSTSNHNYKTIHRRIVQDIVTSFISNQHV
jgi:hypothetical protein